MKKTYLEILGMCEAKAKQKMGDTDYANLHAIWDTSKELIKQGDKMECLNFVAYVNKWWGTFKATEIRGDMIDAGIKF